MRLFIFLFVGVLLAACTKPTIDANVTAFYTPELTTIDTKTIAIRAQEENQESSLEFLSYRPKIEAKLSYVGFTVVKETENPDYIALVSYGLDGTEPKSSTTSSPVFGSVGIGAYGGRSPFFGSVGQSYNTQTWQEYSRFLAIDIVDADTVRSSNSARIYEGRVKSVGRCPTLAGVFDEVLDAMFEDFPGANGKTVFVKIPWDGSCE
ncbi:DUF4136 domain-containing protein [Sneathiella sp.]|uniref:DUF4136 domain-containing protein n=1 Tax=Sneathiella sp. TaxID=1964365 RepID=UPI003564320D